MVWPFNKDGGAPQENQLWKELSRIQNAIDKSSSKHPELSAGWPPETVEKRVKKVLAAYDKLKNEKLQIVKDVHAERQAKLQAQEWARNQDANISRERASHQTQLIDVTGRYERRLESQEIEHKRHIVELETSHSREEEKLKQVAEDLKQGLSSREHIKGLTDREMTTQFKKLSSDIEDFSRTEWDPYRESEWPYSEDELRRLHPSNVRRLKQHIVQNSLWLALYECVFRTPFRIIGDHGQVYDSDLYEAHNIEYDRLGEAKSAELNMKRYENAKVFLTALDSSEPWSADNRPIVESYHHARGAVLSFICQTLNKVTTLDQDQLSTLDGILESTARLWLEVCCQRYRLFVVIPDGSEDVLMFERGATHSLQLVIKPQLQRFGNSRGIDMRQGESLAGWKSQIEVYPTSY